MSLNLSMWGIKCSLLMSQSNKGKNCTSPLLHRLDPLNQPELMPSKKNKKITKQLRREQSQQHREASNWEMGAKLSHPLTEYRVFLDNIRQNGLISSELFVDLSNHLVDSTASLVASLILGTGLTLSLRETDEQKASNSANLSHMEVSDGTYGRAEHDEALIFVKKIIRRAKISFSSFLVALFYIHQYHESNKAPLLVDKFGSSVIPTFLVALIAAEKIVFDATYSSRDWCEFCDHRYTVNDLNDLERTFLAKVDYRIGITPEQFDEFISYLDYTLCYRQMLSRWSLSLSYRDLSILMHGIPHMFKGSARIDVSVMEAVLLLVKIVVGIVSTYVTALFASTVVLRTAHWFATSWETQGDVSGDSWPSPISVSVSN